MGFFETFKYSADGQGKQAAPDSGTTSGPQGVNVPQDVKDLFDEIIADEVKAIEEAKKAQEQGQQQGKWCVGFGCAGRVGGADGRPRTTIVWSARTGCGSRVRGMYSVDDEKSSG